MAVYGRRTKGARRKKVTRKRTSEEEVRGRLPVGRSRVNGSPTKRSKAKRRKKAAKRKKKAATKKDSRQKKTSYSGSRSNKKASERNSSGKKVNAKKTRAKAGAKKARAKKARAKAGAKKARAKAGAKKPAAKKKTRAKAGAKKPSAAARELERYRKKLEASEKKRLRLEEKLRAGGARPGKRSGRKEKFRIEQEKRLLAQEKEQKELEAYGAPKAPKREARKLREAELHASWAKLYEEAKRTGQLPKADGRRTRVNSRRYYGEKRIVQVGEFLDDATIEEIMYKVDQAYKKMSGTYALWLGLIDFSALGDDILGYRNRLLVSLQPFASSFTVENVETTGLFFDFMTVRQKIRSFLEDALSYTHSLIFINYIELWNASRKV